MIIRFFFLSLFALVLLSSKHYGCRSTFPIDSVRDTIRYLPWALFQQGLMLIVFKSLWFVLPSIESLLITVLLFVILHFPNIFLMMVALGMEYSLLLLYVGLGNVWMTWTMMAFIHAVFAVVLKNEFPYSVHHGMRVLFNFSNINENK